MLPMTNHELTLNAVEYDRLRKQSQKHGGQPTQQKGKKPGSSSTISGIGSRQGSDANAVQLNLPDQLASARNIVPAHLEPQLNK